MQLFSANATMFSNFLFFFDAHKKLKKTPQKVAYLVHLGGFFFSAARTAQTSPELHFRFINSFIQSSLLRSLVPLIKMFQYYLHLRNEMHIQKDVQNKIGRYIKEAL